MKHKIIFIIAVFSILLISLKVFSGLSNDPKKLAETLLDKADIKINGSRESDIKVNNGNLYTRVLQQGSIGLGESYMDGWWSCPALDQFFYKLLKANLNEQVGLSWNLLLDLIKAKFTNLQSKERAFEVGEKHYDLSNELFKNMLDPYMQYSCAYWRNANNLNEAQENKLDLICRKLDLKPGMTVLEIGCGWGGFAYYAAKNYGVEVVGITVSKEQAKYAQELCKDLPVTILIQDYRDTKGEFDRIVSIGMFEHVGYKNYKDYMKLAHSCLKDNGLFLLHTIGGNTTTFAGDPWINKYIFPNGMLPSTKQIAESSEGLFIMEDWHNFGTDYDKTLMAWSENFDKNWEKLKHNYDERFYRMWKYYLLSCAGLFRARKAQLWQVVFSKNGIPGGYISVR